MKLYWIVYDAIVMIVRATTETEARLLAAHRIEGRRKSRVQDTADSLTCYEVETDGIAEVVFHEDNFGN